jgi:hypothetical protein
VEAADGHASTMQAPRGLHVVSKHLLADGRMVPVTQPTREITMRTHTRIRLPLTLAAAVVLGACADSAPLVPSEPVAKPLPAVVFQAMNGQDADAIRALTTMAQATARYHDLELAKADGFVFLHGCEVRGDEGPVGIVYIHFGRLMDGVIDPTTPDGLIYEPRKNDKPKLIGVELATPYALWSNAQPPTFLGRPFQAEDEFGVWGLHAWLWSLNPDGLFAESNPGVSCSA